jgi:phosphatidylglycerophosphate synthase
MTRIAALIVANGDSGTLFAGLSLVERAVLSAARAGATRIHVVGASVSRLAAHGSRPAAATVSWDESTERPFADVPSADVLLVLDANTVAEPLALASLVQLEHARSGEAVLLADSGLDAIHRFVEVVDGRVTSIFTNGNASSLNVVAIPRETIDSVRPARTLHQALERLTRLGRLRAVSPGHHFVRRLLGIGNLGALETAYLRHLNGGSSEGFFTRLVRRVSIPVSRRLLRTRVTANQVTLASFALSIACGLFFWMGAYWTGILGAFAYYASVVFDCSDGEVARARFTDSRFGAWLETATDYVSYFLVLGGILLADLRQAGFSNHALGAVIGSAATLAIMLVVGYLRARVASSNPGAFDDALAAELRRGTRMQKFAVRARQLIKRPFLAHLIVFQAAIGHLPVLLEIWACGSIAALIVVIAVQSHVVRAVHVEPLQPVPTP